MASHRPATRRRVSHLLGAAVLAVGLTSGCTRNYLENSLADPSELVAKPSRVPQGLLVPILTSIDPIDEPAGEFPSAEEPSAQDLKVFSADYVIGKNDLISVSIFDLAPGQETVRTSRVSETGMISLPQLPDGIRATGQTELDLQKAIIKRYKDAGLLTDPKVTVVVNEARQRTFSILGAVGRPSQYGIVEANTRLLDAIVLAGEVSTPPDYIYVIRKKASDRPTTQPTAEPIKPNPIDSDPLLPRSQGNRPHSRLVSAELLDADLLGPDNTDTKLQTKDELAPPEDSGGRIGVIGGQGRVIGAATQPSDNPGGVAKGEPDQPPYEFGDTAEESDSRIIRVPYAQLRNGELKYNIVVRPGDMLIVPAPVPGVYYMGGHVARVGTYSLTGQKVTIMDAVISAGMLDGIAVPERAYIVRKIRRAGHDENLFVHVDLAQIFAGKQADVYLKANDRLLVGTNAFSPFISAIRGAFRFSYGGGFTYDKNFNTSNNNNNGG